MSKPVADLIVIAFSILKIGIGLASILYFLLKTHFYLVVALSTLFVLENISVVILMTTFLCNQCNQKPKRLTAISSVSIILQIFCFISFIALCLLAIYSKEMKDKGKYNNYFWAGLKAFFCWISALNLTIQSIRLHRRVLNHLYDIQHAPPVHDEEDDEMISDGNFSGLNAENQNLLTA